MTYEVEFVDGQIREYSTNVIAENMLSRVDSEGFSTTMMEGIVDYQQDESKAIPKEDNYIIARTGQKRMQQTTTGWDLLICWKDQSESWARLSDLKESHPVETVEFAKVCGIHDKPVCAWWSPYILKKRNTIIASVKHCIRKTTHKYGVEIPTSGEHAMELDRTNNNTMWRDALTTEMYNVTVAFKVLDEGQKAPAGWHEVTGHLVWDVKIDFTQKARWVLDGHKSPDPIGSTFEGVVSRESMHIAFTYVALNGLDICAVDIQNAYLQAPSLQRDYIMCGPEFGIENVGKVALIHRALYGGKSVGKDFRSHLRSCMHHLQFVTCPADPDMWMQPVQKSDGSPCYEYVLLYKDNTLVVSERAEEILWNEII